MKSKRLFMLIIFVFMLGFLYACSPAQSDSKQPTKQLELALSSVRRVKIRFHAQATMGGQVTELLSGQGQFETTSDNNTKPLTYISTDQIAIFLSENKGAIRLGSNKWQIFPVADSLINSITKIQKGIPNILDKDLFNATGLNLTSNNLESNWQSFGTTALDGQQVYSFQRTSTDTLVWNGIFGIASPGSTIKKTLSELWVGTANNLPYRVRFTLYFKTQQSATDSTLEINLYPYDYNEPLKLPGDLP